LQDRQPERENAFLQCLDGFGEAGINFENDMIAKANKPNLNAQPQVIDPLQ
jgi:hypothetical protein